MRWIDKRGAAAMAAALALAACATIPAATPDREILIAGSGIYPESMDADRAGNIYVGSSGGTIYRASAGADRALPFITPDARNGLQSLYGILVDEPRGMLWACSNPPFGAPPATTPQPPAIAAFALDDGSLQGRWPFPAGERPVTCNDMAIDAGGTLFTTDIASGRIYALARGGTALTLFADDPALVGADGIAFAGDGTMYINNVRQHLVQRVNRGADGAYAGLTTLTLSQPVNGPDALRPVGGNRFLQAEGGSGRIALVEIEGDRATVTTVTDQFDSVASVARVGSVGYSAEGKIAYLFDPALAGQDPGAFTIESFPLPPGL